MGMNLPGGHQFGDAPADPENQAAARRAAQRRKLDEVFGDVLPTVTRDEVDDGQDGRADERDQWYRDNRPPHHA
jgi:hypothetical protein